MKLNIKGASKILKALRQMELSFDDPRDDFMKIDFDLDDFVEIDVVEKVPSLWQRIKRFFGVKK